MIKNYYVQKNTDTAKDIFSEYGIIVMATKGLNQLPEIKPPFSREWQDEQGDDIYIPSTAFFKSKKVTLTFRLQKDTVDDIKTAIESFLQYIIPNGYLNYFDTYRKEGFRGYYDKQSISTESYRVTGSYVEWDMDFIAPNGICFGFDNTGNSSIFVEMISGTADIYFSNGTSNLGVTEDFIRTLTNGFAIVCPSIYGGVNITARLPKLLGTYVSSTGRIYGVEEFISKSKLLGI